MVLENSKLAAFSEQTKLNSSSFMGYHIGITPTLLVNVDDLEIKITPAAYGLLHGKEICPKVRNSKPCNNLVGVVKMFGLICASQSPTTHLNMRYTGWKI